MFLESSRYARVAQETVQARDGRSVTAIRLRRLPVTPGERYFVRDDERLDLISNARYADDTRFWHIADANSALDAATLVAETGAVIEVPTS